MKMVFCIEEWYKRYCQVGLTKMHIEQWRQEAHCWIPKGFKLLHIFTDNKVVTHGDYFNEITRERIQIRLKDGKEIKSWIVPIIKKRKNERIKSTKSQTTSRTRNRRKV